MRTYQTQNLNNVASRLQETVSSTAKVEVYFSNFEGHLARHIASADAVVGCVAWLTHPGILLQLSKVPCGVSLIVQKEDFLRPDFNASSNWKKALRYRYNRLKSITTWPGSLDIVSVNVNGDRLIEPVRCAGFYNRAGASAMPRMHHKFLVFCRIEILPTSDECIKYLTFLRPYAVWTGSFNLTLNAVNSLENSVMIFDETVADAYFNEWIEVAWISESLDWNVDWIQPEWTCT